MPADRRHERVDFRVPLPMSDAAARVVAPLADAAPRVGRLLAAACGRSTTTTCGAVRRVALAEVATSGDVWAAVETALPEPGLVVLPHPSVVALADLFLGGMGSSASRPSSALEQLLALDNLAPALAPLADALGLGELRVGPATADPLPSGLGELLAVPLDIALPSGMSARVTVCLPARSLLPAEPGPVEPEPVPAADAALGPVPVQVQVRATVDRVPAAELEELAPGDVVRLPVGALDDLLGSLSGRPVLRGALGRRGPRLAVTVSHVLGGS